MCGGAGGSEQPLSLLMGMDPDVVELCMSNLIVDMVPPVGVAQDLAHLERKCSVKGYETQVGKNPIDHLEEYLTFCHLVHVPAGVPRKSSVSRDDLLATNAGIAKGSVEACAMFCLNAVAVREALCV